MFRYVVMPLEAPEVALREAHIRHRWLYISTALERV